MTTMSISPPDALTWKQAVFTALVGLFEQRRMESGEPRMLSLSYARASTRPLRALFPDRSGTLWKSWDTMRCRTTCSTVWPWRGADARISPESVRKHSLPPDPWGFEGRITRRLTWSG